LLRLKPIILSPGWTGDGKYKFVRLSAKNKISNRKVHHLVLETFVGPRIHGQICRHLNGIKTDNRAANLAWGTHTENMLDMRLIGSVRKNQKLTPEIVSEIRANPESVGSLANQFGVSKQMILYIKSGLKWKNLHLSGSRKPAPPPAAA
jgi:hypothetical protein